ncbi:MAG: FAD-binding protein [Bacillota bacterium]|nr:FAD-binding protein [Bacillota bacterium]
MTDNYDVVIVGAGPAGIFAALELAGAGLSAVVLEKGPALSGRLCPANERGVTCRGCNPCSMVSGWGGAGAFSDGKLTLSPEIGGNLGDYVGLERLKALIGYVDELYVAYGAPKEVHGTDEERLREIARRATLAELRFVPGRIRHLGTGRTGEILSRMFDHLKDRVEIRTRTAAQRLLVRDGRVAGIETAEGEVVAGRYVVVAPGREGAEWLARQAQALGLSLAINPVDLGVRVELPAAVMSPLTDVAWESKFIYHSRSFDDRVRTFCMCPHGFVTSEHYDGEDGAGIVTVNGHSHAERRTENTNFALLVSKTFTEPFKEPITYGKYIAGLANLLGGGVLVQRLGDLLDGHRSTPERIAKGLVRPTLPDATPGDLSLVFPYRHLVSILEMLKAMDALAPGVYGRHTLLYGVEVKFYSSRLELSPSLETRIANLFAVGDGAGVTRGLVQASASGVVVAREILRREGRKPVEPVRAEAVR